MAPKRDWTTRTIEATMPALTIVLFMLAWELLVRLRGIPPIYLPAPSSIADYLWRMIADGTIAYHLGITLLRIFAGFLLAAVTGILLGVLMGMSRVLARDRRRLDRRALSAAEDLADPAADHLARHRRGLQDRDQRGDRVLPDRDQHLCGHPPGRPRADEGGAGPRRRPQADSAQGCHSRRPFPASSPDSSSAWASPSSWWSPPR